MMKNLKIGAKIFLGFSCIFILLLAIMITSIITSLYTGSNIDDVDIYVDLHSNANELMHILNETRITAGVLYETNSLEAYNNAVKQLMYCDARLKKLYDYIDSQPKLSGFRANIEQFDSLYSKWRSGINEMNNTYNLEQELSKLEKESFTVLAGEMRKTNLLAHEILSNTISYIQEVDNNNIKDTKDFNIAAIWTVILISVISVFVAIFFAIKIIRSITIPVDYMRKTLEHIGQSGDLRISDDVHKKLSEVASGKDETARCMSELLILINRLNDIDHNLSYVADGDLTLKVSLQSEQDTMGLAVDKMLKNLNQKFSAIMQSTNWVHQKTEELTEGSHLLATGSREQAQSVGHLLNTVNGVNQKTEQNKILAKNAADLSDSIQKNANSGTENMNQMIQAVTEINEASQSISKIIKLMDDIAFQTNILALNAAVEAARAGQYGKGFAVVAEEVRNLAAKSSEAAQNTGSLIENTVQKAALGASIAEVTSKSFEEIVKGVNQSSGIIGDISNYFQEQASDIYQILKDAENVEHVVEQNNKIASQSAEAAQDISEQSNLLKELVKQFRLINT